MSTDLLAIEALKSYRIAGNVYLLGALEKSLTVYSQQVRALNLVWAMASKYQSSNNLENKRIAVVGSGIAGITAAAAALLVFPGVSLCVLERSSAVCPLLQGSDTRWLHPRIYSWPDPGSRAPSASLPVLNWREGRASDVVDHVLTQFRVINDYARTNGRSCQICVTVSGLKVDVRKSRITWTGRFIDTNAAAPRTHHQGDFDAIILATGFGIEVAPTGCRPQSYWRNESIGQPNLDGGVTKHLVSGFGDGALIDLCRLTIERFRQDRIIDELFGPNPEPVEAVLRRMRTMHGHGAFLTMLSKLPGSLTAAAIEKLKARRRRDTEVVLHAAGSRGRIKTLGGVLEHRTSFLNKFLLFLLHEAGSFKLDFSPSLEKLIRTFPRNSVEVLCRHGTSAYNELKPLLPGWSTVKLRLDDMKAAQAQRASLLAPAGFYPYVRE